MNSIYSTLFVHKNDHKYSNMAYILEQSISKYMPNWKFNLLKTEAPEDNTNTDNNRLKMKMWHDINDSNPYILMDCDTYLRKDISDVFTTYPDFDIALTERSNKNYTPFNVGVVFVRPSKKTKLFFKQWEETVSYLYNHQDLLKSLKRTYKAICQSSLGYMLNNNTLDYLNIKWLPCKEYNACEEDWCREIPEEARVIHLKTRHIQAELFRTDTLKFQHIKKEYGQYKTLPSHAELEKFRKRVKHEPNFNNPKTYNEKIGWKKHNDRNPLITITSDKVAVRDYIIKKGLEDILVPLIDISSEPYSDETLPKKGIIKPNNASQRYLFLDRIKNIHRATKKVNRWLNFSYGTINGEWAYSQIQPKLITEELICDKPSNALKLLCFHGKPYYIYAQTYSLVGQTISPTNITLYDLEWNKQDVKMLNLPNIDLPKPNKSCLSKAIEVSKILSEPFDFVRVDLHWIDNKIYFSELTHYPTSGSIYFSDPSWDKNLGSYWNINN